MKILVIEDDTYKLERTLRYIKSVTSEELEIDTAGNQVDAKRLLSATKYDRIVIDMQLPKRGVGSIDIIGGVNILLYLSIGINSETKRVINSSSSETRDILDKNNFANEVLIVNNTGVNCTTQFNKFINNKIEG